VVAERGGLRRLSLARQLASATSKPRAKPREKNGGITERNGVVAERNRCAARRSGNFAAMKRGSE
jgi:hypothetical protein